jgi:hypothetical protein
VNTPLLDAIDPFWWVKDNPKPTPEPIPTSLSLDAETWGIDNLDLKMAATREDIENGLPWVRWGTTARKDKYPGRCVHYFVDDWKFTAIQKHPEALVKTGASVAVEPNFSTWPGQPLAESLWTIYRKRRISAWWQTKGVKILVDLNVAPEVRKIAILGVPDGWKSYATRKHPDMPWSETFREHELACGRAGTDGILFCLFGGGKEARKISEERGWLWCQGRPPWRKYRPKGSEDG